MKRTGRWQQQEVRCLICGEHVSKNARGAGCISLERGGCRRREGILLSDGADTFWITPVLRRLQHVAL